MARDSSAHGGTVPLGSLADEELRQSTPYDGHTILPTTLKYVVLGVEGLEFGGGDEKEASIPTQLPRRKLAE